MTDNRITRRQLALTASAAAAAMFPIRVRAQQQNYPTRPVRFILPFAAAGVADITARLAAEKLGDKLGQRFVVENQPGPGGIAAARAVLSQAPDGYTIGLVTNGTSISAAIYKALPFDPVKEFATISTIGAFDLVFATNVESELKTFDDFIKRVRARSTSAPSTSAAPRIWRGSCSKPRPPSTSKSFPTAARPMSSSPSCAT